MVTTYNGADVELPDELDESTSTWIGEIVKAEFALPPTRKQQAIVAGGGTPRPEFHLAIQPLSFRYESDRSKFDNDLEDRWTPVYRKDGSLQTKGSTLDEYKQAFMALGYPLRNNADAAALVGKKFRFSTVVKKVEGYSDQWLAIPDEPADDYVAPATVQVRYRPPRPKTGQPVQAFGNGNHATADLTKPTEILKRVLQDKSEAEYLTAIVTSAGVVGDADAKAVMTEPFISEAQAGSPLTSRMVAAGMTVVDGRLT